VAKVKKKIGVQQVLLSPDREVEAVLNYLCQQSGKLYNSGVYLARETFFQTGKLLTGKFDLSFEPSISNPDFIYVCCRILVSVVFYLTMQALDRPNF
jgi:hypothetical protein